MAQDNWQKAKLLKLVELLRQETDEQHPLTTSQICARLDESGYPCDRRVLSKDIAVLNSVGVEVLWKTVGKSKAYYIEDRAFSLPELQILIDAVLAASFITERKTDNLIDKIANLGGTHRGELLKGALIHYNTHKHSNEKIYYSIDAILHALLNNRKITFQYFDLGVNKEVIYRRYGEKYEVDPICLVFNRDNYYLVTCSPRYAGVVNYRVDRMHHVEVLYDNISDQALSLRDSMGTYTEQAFKMFSGPVETVTLEFDRALINSVLDHFGDTITMEPVGATRARTTVEVQISPTFFSWVFQFAERMDILGPDNVVERYEQHLRTVLERISQNRQQFSSNS